MLGNQDQSVGGNCTECYYSAFEHTLGAYNYLFALQTKIHFYYLYYFLLPLQSPLHYRDFNLSCTPPTELLRPRKCFIVNKLWLWKNTSWLSSSQDNCAGMANRKKKLFYLEIYQTRFLITENYCRVPKRPFLQSNLRSWTSKVNGSQQLSIIATSGRSNVHIWMLMSKLMQKIRCLFSQ